MGWSVTLPLVFNEKLIVDLATLLILTLWNLSFCTDKKDRDKTFRRTMSENKDSIFKPGISPCIVIVQTPNGGFRLFVGHKTTLMSKPH